MGRAKENFNNVFLKSEPGKPMPQHYGALRNIFWAIMDSKSLTEHISPGNCHYSIEAWGKRCYLVEKNPAFDTVSKYEILNCPYPDLRKRILVQHGEE